MATSRVRCIRTDLFANGNWKILLAISLGWGLSIGTRFIFPALVPLFQAEFGISLTWAGLLLTMLWASYAVGHIPGGILGDYFGEGNIMIFSALIASGTMLLIAISANSAMLFLGTISFGLATSLFGPNRLTILVDIFQKRSGTAIGVTMAAGSLGNSILPASAALIATYYSWRYGFYLFAVFFILSAVLLGYQIPRPALTWSSNSTGFSVHDLLQTLRAIRKSRILPVYIIQISISFVLQGFLSFYPLYLATIKGLRPELAALLFSLFFIFGMILQPVSGGIMDNIGIKSSLIIFVCFCTSGLVLLPLIENIFLLILITLLISTWNGSAVMTQTYITDSLPKDMRGTSLGALKASWMLMGATSPLLIGILADNNFFDLAIFILACIGFCSLVITYRYL